LSSIRIIIFISGCGSEKGVYTCFVMFLAQMKGEAEAFAVEAKAKAEAEQLARKAEAWKQYEDAAVVDMVLEMLPKVFSSPV